MFKNFDKVFKFTFKNQTSTNGYKFGTIITALILFMIPVIVFVLAGVLSNEEDDELKTCGVDRIYVVDELSPEAKFDTLNMLGVEGYEDIQYSNAASVEEALSLIEERNETTSVVLEIKKEYSSINSRIILPDASTVEEEDVENYNDFIEEIGTSFAIIASGVSVQDLGQIMAQTESSVYDTEGYKNGTDLYSDQDKLDQQKNEEILPVFRIILTYTAVVIIYMIIILYGNSILQNIVLEKSSKLMDTMLISVSPEALIFGKMLAIITSGIMQLFIWIAGLVGGMVVGLKIYDIFYGDIGGTVVSFLKSFSEMGLFKPVNVIIGILALIVGIIMYASMSAVAGAISSTREEAASNQSLFVVVLLIAFYAVLFKGISTSNVATWLYLVPFTSAMVLPSGICTGVISTGVAAAGLGILIICCVGLIILAGRLYKMMSLYKGNAVNISKALKMLAGK